jgi:hypothetical protein
MKFPQTPYPLLTSAVDTPRGNTLLVFAYLGIIINCNAAITSFLISDKMAETPFTSAKNNYHNAPGRANTTGSAMKEYEGDGINSLFVKHSDWQSWRYYTVYCEPPNYSHIPNTLCLNPKQGLLLSFSASFAYL